ncbi:hypothetical protein ACEE23_09205 [Corynebacterium sp. 32222D000AT]|uniref:hypothetical protein n=1 Tax=unclassified Corynebacterium TaxID=2624378 RepID=UPI002A96B767|nr:hypothetical protein [Mycobacteriaceae bacterium]MDY5828962.1 hypothetical protein [Corynebacterium sp.]
MSLNDAEWLAQRVFRDLTRASRPQVERALRESAGPVLLSPHHLPQAAAGHVAAVAGFPTGRHHSLIKATEARLAVQNGAAEIWVAVDATLNDPNALLTDLVTVREACPDPVVLGVILPAADAAADATVLDTVLETAEKAGYQRAITRGDQEGSETTRLEQVYWADAPLDTAQQVDALAAGRVAIAAP